MNNKFNCSRCGAELILDSGSNQYMCEYCKSLYILDKNNKLSFAVNYNICNCPNCGIELISNQNIDLCFNCNTKMVIKEKSINYTDYKYIIPFKTEKSVAKKMIRKRINKKIFVSSFLKRKKRLRELKGIYVPVTLYGYDVNGTLETENKRVTSWNSNNYKYTKTDVYNSTRSGSMEFENILVNNISTLDKENINYAGNFDYNDVVDFKKEYINDYILETPSISKDDALAKSTVIAQNLFVDELKKKIIGYDSVKVLNTTFDLKRLYNCQIYLPIWVLNIKFKNKLYSVIINGQTGNFYTNIKINVKKIVIFYILVFLLIVSSLFLLYYLGVIK